METKLIDAKTSRYIAIDCNKYDKIEFSPTFYGSIDVTFINEPSKMDEFHNDTIRRTSFGESNVAIDYLENNIFEYRYIEAKNILQIKVPIKEYNVLYYIDQFACNMGNSVSNKFSFTVEFCHLGSSSYFNYNVFVIHMKDLVNNKFIKSDNLGFNKFYKDIVNKFETITLTKYSVSDEDNLYYCNLLANDESDSYKCLVIDKFNRYYKNHNYDPFNTKYLIV